MVARAHLAGLLLVAGVMLSLGFYATKLNRDFYREHMPFFDSCSYSNQFAGAAALTRSDGILGGIRGALNGNVALPWLEAALLARWIAPSRPLEVWLQWFWLTLLALSLYWYFTQYRGADPLLGLCLTLPFISFARIYDWNGGLSDFRMDLSLYIFVALTSVWYLVTYRTNSRLPWFLAGISAMLAFLARATTPVYLVIMLGPLWLARVWQAESKLRVPLLRKTAYLVLPAAAGLLFQIYNYHYLYFYYITEKVDANRHLPLSQSILHLGLAGSHLGVVTALCSLVVLVIRFGSHRAQSVRQIDWKIFWLAWAPALFLMLSGAGLNPFVSMPSVFGLLLFSYFPLREGIPVAGWKRSAVCLLLAGSSLFNAAGAKRPQLFIGANQTRMAGLKTLMDRINHDAAALRRPVVRYLIPELGDFHDCAFTDSLIYEYGGTPQPDGTIRLPSGVRYSSTRPDLFAAPDADFWKWNVPARGGSSEMDAVTSIAMSVPDYLLLPTGPTLAFLENRQAFKFINLKVRELKRRLLAIPVWTELGAPVAVSPDESIQLYSRIPAGSPAPRN